MFHLHSGPQHEAMHCRSARFPCGARTTVTRGWDGSPENWLILAATMRFDCDDGRCGLTATMAQPKGWASCSVPVPAGPQPSLAQEGHTVSLPAYGSSQREPQRPPEEPE